ncbi:MAG: PEP-CTERM sorting domain-containing protein [Acidobacteria bacterium]|nr:PEP-CTERM sorting domain-containing protein [Acidobacteriota bacterium]
MKINHFLAISAMLVGSSVLATPIYGTANVNVTINGVTTTTPVPQNTKTGSISGGNANFRFGMDWDVDPTLTWTYTTATSGLHVIQFQTNIVGNPYNQLFNSAGFTLTGGAGASIKNVSVKVYIPSFTTYIAAGDVSLPNVTLPKAGNITKNNDNTNSGGVGPYVGFGPTNLGDATMGVEISFNAVLGSLNSLSMNGTLDIQKDAPPVPEPATFGLIGAALIALGSIARRRA